MTGEVSLALPRILEALHQPVSTARLRTLVSAVLPYLRPDTQVLDVGCGFGAMGREIMDHRDCPPGVVVKGLECSPRDERLIEIDVYDGREFPYEDDAYDTVMMADVLHHARSPQALLAEAARVSRRLVIVKDHKLDGPLARARLSLIDWAANAPYDVSCLYLYNTLEEWRDWHRTLNLEVLEERVSMDLYPPVVNLLFGRRLHYLAVSRPRKGG